MGLNKLLALHLSAAVIFTILLVVSASHVAYGKSSECASVVVLLDNSWSVSKEGLKLEEKLLYSLASRLSETSIKVVVFNTRIEGIYSLRGIHGALGDLVAFLESSWGGGTNLYGALEKAAEIASGECSSVFIIVTDGYPTSGVVDENNILGLAESLKERGGKILVAVLGENPSKLAYKLGDKVYRLREGVDQLVEDVAASLGVQVSERDDFDGDGLPDSLERALAEQYLPIMVFDNNELMYPSTVEYYYSNLGFYRGEGDQLLATSLNPALIRELAPGPWLDSSDSYEYYIDKFNDHKASEEEIEHEFPNTAYRYNHTVYYHVVPIGDGKIMLSYWFFYPLNDPPWGVAYWFFAFNLHEGDWEHVAIILEEQNGVYQPTIVYYCPHEWVEKYSYSEVEKIGSHIIIAVGRGSHASYRITQIPFFEDNGLNGIVIAPEDIDENTLLEELSAYGATPSGVERWTTLVNLGEPTNYTRAYIAVIGEAPLLRLDNTTPLPETLFIDSKARWGVWAPPLSFASSGAPTPSVQKDFYNPEKKPVIPVSEILSFYKHDKTMLAILLGYTPLKGVLGESPREKMPV